MSLAAYCSHRFARLSLVAAVALLIWPAPRVSAAPESPPLAQAVPPTQPAPAGQPTRPEPQQPAGEFWVQNFEITELWSGPNDAAIAFGWLRKFSYLRVERWEAARLYVFNPRSQNFAYVNAAVVGPSGPPPSDYLEPLRTLATLNLPGRLIGRVNLYAEPATDEAVWLRTAGHNAPVAVEARVESDDGVWYRLGSGEYVSVDQVRLPGPPAASYPGKWIDADLSDPTIVTAYEGNRPVASALAIRGVAAWRTPTGTYRIQRRVANEIMSSEGLGIPRNAPGGYYVKDVLFTQYFTGDGAAIHYNYWSGNFGYPGSHGCLGMNYEDSLWFWHWAEVGTPIVVHY